MRVFWLLQLFLFVFSIFLNAHAARLKDVANIRGVRDNQLIGYGIVVGLNGTGDSKMDYTNKSLLRMLDKLGMPVEGDASSKNVAAVLVTATLPAFAKAGNKLDVTVNAIGDASKLEGGTLVQTPLRAANQQVFAVAQGSVSGGAQATARVPNGAIIERDVAADFNTRKMFRLTLHNPDFTTAARVAKTINEDLGGKFATAKDAGSIDIVVPFSYEGRGVEFLANVENLDVLTDVVSKVVINEKTGTVIIGDGVRVKKVAISHGDLSVKVEGGGGTSSIRGPASTGGRGGGGDRIALVNGEVSVGDLVRAFNSLGVSPKDLIIILQNIKAAGALEADLEIL